MIGGNTWASRDVHSRRGHIPLSAQGYPWTELTSLIGGLKMKIATVVHIVLEEWGTVRK